MEPLHGLACHLTNTVSRYDSQSSVPLAEYAGYSCHGALHKYGQLVMGHVFQQIELYIRKRSNIEPESAGELRQLFRQVNDLLFCPLAGVGRGIEVNSLHLNSSFSHKEGGNRAVYSSGKHYYSLSG